MRSAESRSSASSTSISMSASRVTRKTWNDSIFMPGKSRSRWAAITCSIGTKRRPPETLRKRGRSGGTFTRAKRGSRVSGSRAITARFSDRLEMYGNGMRRVDGERRQHGEDAVLEHLAQLLAVRRLELVPVDDADARASRASSRMLVRRSGPRGSTAPATRARIASSCSRGLSPSGEVVGEARRRLLLEPGDANLEELVEEAAEEGEEVDALEQRLRVVGGERSTRS